MRINPKMFFVPGENQPFEVQEFDNRKIELFYMNDYDEILKEQINKGKFAVWSSNDGVNYRVFLEKGCYEVVSELYSAKINKIWVDFWDKTEKISKKLTNFGLLPIGAVAIIVCMISGLFGEIGSYISIGVLIASFIAMLIVNRMIKSKVLIANRESRDLIIKTIGEKKFDKLLDAQKEYMDAYYESLYPEDEIQEEAEAVEIEDTKEVEQIEEIKE
jgi:hypothetical protein